MTQNIPASVRADLDRLCELLAREFAVEASSILSSDRHKQVARARAALWLCMRERYQLSYPEMARMLGYDHTTIMYGIKRARALEGDCSMFRIQFRQARGEWLRPMPVGAQPGERLRVA